MRDIILLCLLPILSLQWWDVGHMLTAAIAEERLNDLHPYAYINFKELTLSINHLVDNRSRTFIQTACWPDDIKSSKYNMGLWNAWHYTDKTYVYDGVFPIINFTEVAVNSIELVNHAVKTISTNINRTTAERALFARYLVHVVGDMHQPLHSVALFNQTFPSGDRGGNSIKIKLINQTSQNLHAFWDAGAFVVQNDTWSLTRPLNLQNLTALKSVVANYMKVYGPSIQKLATDIDPMSWALESYRIAINTTYPHFATTNQVNQKYIDMAYQQSKRRITLAGYRLANLIISIYDKAPHKPTPVQQLWQHCAQQMNKIAIQQAVD